MFGLLSKLKSPVTKGPGIVDDKITDVIQDGTEVDKDTGTPTRSGKTLDKEITTTSHHPESATKIPTPPTTETNKIRKKEKTQDPSPT